MAEHAGLPVAGYTNQTDENIAKVNVNKQLEERVLRRIDELKNDPNTDKRMVAEAHTCIQGAFMWLNRAIMQPQRISLPED